MMVIDDNRAILVHFGNWMQLFSSYNFHVFSVWAISRIPVLKAVVQAVTQ